MNTGMALCMALVSKRTFALAHALKRATILGTLCHVFFEIFKYYFAYKYSIAAMSGDK